METNTSNEPTDTFNKLAEHCLLYKFGLIIGTASNAHHTAWGNRNSNTHGFKLLNRLAQTGLLWENNGKFTFQHNRQETAINLTLPNDFAPKINFWDTNPDFSLSDHFLNEFVINLDNNKIKTRLIRSINKKRCN
jgi:hypothetical protein